MAKLFIIIFSTLILLLSGCDGRIVANIGSQPSDSLSADENSYGEYINIFASEIENLDRSASELYTLYDIATYHWYSKNAEIFEIDGRIVLFSSEIYDQDAKSTAIMFSNYTDWTLDMILARFGAKLKYHDETLLGFYKNGFYEIAIDKYTFRFILNAAKDGLYEECPNVMVQLTGSAWSSQCEAGTTELLNHYGTLNCTPKSMRTGQVWDRISAYTFDIGKYFDQLYNDISVVNKANELILNKFYATNGFTDESGISFLSSADDDICSMIVVPVTVAFQTKDSINMSFLKETLNTHFSWSGYNGYGYMFYFDDVKIFVTSNSSGVIESQDFVTISAA